MEELTDLGEGLDCLISVLETVNPCPQSLEHILLDARASISIPRMVESLENLVDHPIRVAIIEPRLSSCIITLIGRHLWNAPTCTNNLTVF